MLPTADFFGTGITRLILGDNAFIGNSYLPDTIAGSEMMDYYTADRITGTLFEAEKAGINTYLAIASPFILRVIRQYRNKGGKMKLIFQTYPPENLEANLRQMLEWEPVAIYHQGTTADYYTETGGLSTLLDRLKMIKKTGLPAGLATHVPETVLRAEEEGWGADFYMACLGNSRKGHLGEQSAFLTGKSKRAVFCYEDRYQMFKVVQKVRKPFLVFKLFSGGQVFEGRDVREHPLIVEKIFRETYFNIKAGDIAVVGVYQKQGNQVKENADILKKVLGSV